jgi:hypothetical protein
VQEVRQDREGPRVKNVQINGNVYGGVHFHGSTPLLAAVTSAPDVSSSRSRSWGWTAAKAVAVIVGVCTIVPIGLCVALAVGAFAATFLLAIMVLVVGFWLVCRLAQLLLVVENAVGGGMTQLVYVPSFRRDNFATLGTGDRINELESTEMTRYVD